MYFDINYSGSASSDDFISGLTTNRVFIENNKKSTSISLPVLDDVLFENDEDLTLIISNSSSFSLDIKNSTNRVSIIDNDNINVPIIIFGGDGFEETESEMEFNFKLGKVNNTGTDVKLSLDFSSSIATEEDFYSKFPKYILIPNGSDNTQIKLKVKNDGIREVDESIVLKTEGDGVFKSNFESVLFSNTKVINYGGDLVKILNNGISPNGDGKNDVWSLKTAENTVEPSTRAIPIDVYIYDRNGQLLFKMLDYDNSWNGVDLNGNMLISGDYYYEIRVRSNEFTSDITNYRGIIHVRR